MEDPRSGNAGRGPSSVSKALPVPPPSNESARRGKTNPFPTSNRALPPIPDSNMFSSTTISRRPVGSQADVAKSPNMQQAYKPFMRKEQLDNIYAERTPPLPPKDNKTRQLPDLPEPPNHLHSSSISSTGSSPKSGSPRTEIWRRRSVKSDRSVNIPDLKLKKSNGSTTDVTLSSINHPTPNPAPQNTLPPLPTQPTRVVVGLPGRSIKKPVPARPTPPQPDPMGAKLSKGLKLEKKDGAAATEIEKPMPKLPESQPSPYTRLPTPEYQLNDKQLQYSPAPQTFSPVSPETPPRDISPELRPQLPPPDEKTAGPYSLQNLNIPSLLLPGYNRESSLPLDIISDYAMPRSPISPHPQKPSISSISTVKQPPSQVTANWPASSDLPRTPAIFSSMALSVVHLDCFQLHRQMRSSRNDVCPLGCMVCDVKDTEKRWTCTFCSLRCCDACMKGLVSIPGRNLRKFLEWIGKSSRLSQREGGSGG